MKTNISPSPRGKATRVDWNGAPLPTQPLCQYFVRPSPAGKLHRWRRAIMFLLPIVLAMVALSLTACTSEAGDIARYSPSGGRSGGQSSQSAQMVNVLTPQVMRPTAIPPTALPVSYVSNTPASEPSAFSQADLARMANDETGAWILVAMIAGSTFIAGVIVGIMLGGGRRG